MKISKEEFVECLPKKLKGNVTDKLVNTINNLAGDKEAANLFRDNVMSYGDLLSQGRYKLSNYLEASLFVAHKQLGKSNVDAWIATFPKKYQKYVGSVPDKTIATYASAYAKNKLVVSIMDRALVPVHILFADEYYKAVKVQVELMYNASSDTVRQKASEAIMRELKPPMEAKVKVEVTDSSGVMDSLAEAVAKLSSNQREKIIEGSYTTKEIAHSNITKASDDDKE